jgi:drug/metabolite transporter (DMT)-like permease
MQPAAPTPAQGRLCILFASLLWSLSGAFTKILTQDTVFHANDPPLDTLHVGGLNVPVQIACYRVLFAGLALAPTLRRRDLQFRPLMVAMVACFAVMNALFITAQALGPAANAILLQYSAPLWMYLACIFLLGEKADRRSTVSILLGVSGVGIIVAGGWDEGDLTIIAIALGSGVTYAGVLICLRVLRGLSARWLTVWNHLLSGLCLVPLLFVLRPPTWYQYAILVCFGAFQMGLAYWLVARGLQSVSPQEAGTITLLEPLLNPVWAFLVSPESESRTHPLTFVGGAVILAALAWRYWPVRIRPSDTRGAQT